MPQTFEIPEVLITANPPNIDHGGTADSWDPSGLGLHSNDFVISGVATNHDPVIDGGHGIERQRSYANSSRAYQDALNAIGNPSVPSILQWLAPYLGPQGFAIFVEGYDQNERTHAAITTPGQLDGRSARQFHPFGPPDVYPFLNPSPDTREASIGAKIASAIGAALMGTAEAGESIGLGTRASAREWPADLPDWAPARWPAAAQNPFAYSDSDSMPGTYWTSATNLYGEPTGVPVYPTKPVSSPDWNQPTGFSRGLSLSGDDIFGYHPGSPNWFNNFNDPFANDWALR